MPRICETGTVHNTYGEIRGCSTCQRNGAASRVHAKHGNEELVDPAPEPAVEAPARPVTTDKPKRRR